MIELALIWLASLAWLWWLCATAPLGWQDDEGFHRGERD